MNTRDSTVIAGAGLAVRTQASRWPARLDLVQSLSGLALALFMWGHMFFVSSILLGKDVMWTVSRACEVQLAMQGKGEAIPISREVLEKCVVDALQFNPKYGAGQDSFAALQRLVDRKDPSYRM